MSAEVPSNRFSVLMQKASELCAEVRALGGQLLAALEKKDGEQLSLVRASHERSLHQLVREVKEANVREAGNAREALEQARVSAVRRLNDARQYLAKPPLQPAVGSALELVPLPALGLKVQNIDPPNTTLHQLVNPHELIFDTGEASPLSGCLMMQEEARELKLLEQARAAQQAAEDTELIGSFLRYIPTTHTHIEPFGIGFDLEIGGRTFGEIAGVIAHAFRAKAGQQNQQASQHARAGGFLLRQNDWVQRHNQAALDVMHVDKQIVGAMIRAEMAQKDLDTQQRQVDNAEEMERLIRDKFSNEATYTWMSQHVSRLHDAGFAVALDIARKAQRAYRHETGVEEARFIAGDYWDDGRSGLLAGERLHQALKRMEVAYLETNVRELELTKHVSLRERFPQELFDLLESGACEIDLTEQLFDADYPGHYMRRLKGVSLSIPCVAGPYTNVNCTLTLQSHRRRRKTVGGTTYAENPPDNDTRFSYGFGPVQSIATSTGQNDAGVFEVNFRDEHYLPFERAGAISRWRIELPPAHNQFDTTTVTDVVLHLKYTAREAGGLLAHAAATELATAVRRRAGTLAIDVARDFPDAWAAARQPGVDLTFVVTARHFPFIAGSAGSVRMLIGPPSGGSASHDKIRLRGDATTVITCRRASNQTVTTFADLTKDGAGISVSIPRAAFEGRRTAIVLVDYARAPG
jgi:hypothetical protein